MRIRSSLRLAPASKSKHESPTAVRKVARQVQLFCDPSAPPSQLQLSSRRNFESNNVFALLQDDIVVIIEWAGALNKRILLEAMNLLEKFQCGPSTERDDI